MPVYEGAALSVFGHSPVALPVWYSAQDSAFGPQSGIRGSQLSGIVLLPGVSGGFDVSAVAVEFDVFAL